MRIEGEKHLVTYKVKPKVQRQEREPEKLR